MHVFLLSNSQSKAQATWMDTHLAITKDSVYTLGLRLMCSKLLPIILLEFPRTFTYYSFVLSLLFQTEDTLALEIQASK